VLAAPKTSVTVNTTAPVLPLTEVTEVTAGAFKTEEILAKFWLTVENAATTDELTPAVVKDVVLTLERIIIYTRL
jgi:hypothetical protein